MAIFGFNLTLTVIGVFFLRKLIPILNLPPRFLKGFYRFLPPSEQMLRETNNQPAKKTLGGNVKKRKNQEPEKKDFVVNKVKFQSYWQLVENSSNCFFRNFSLLREFANGTKGVVKSAENQIVLVAKLRTSFQIQFVLVANCDFFAIAISKFFAIHFTILVVKNLRNGIFRA